MERTVRIDLGERSYDVRIAPGILGELGATAAGLDRVSSVMIVSDTTVARLYGKRALDSLASAGLAAQRIDFPAGEQHKNLSTFGALVDKLLTSTPPIDRDCLIVALGGGVTGDMAGFVAASALRGLQFLQCPTTLLADVDSSVGGKTGVDHAAGKNLIGAFYQPRGVLIDVETLTTLPADELRNGLAECVKHGVIRDASLLDFIESEADAIFAHDPEVMTELIARNVAIKAAVVGADEREAGQRTHLNFGHTIGHAVEVFVGYDRLPHGQAVSLGMVAANAMAMDRGLIDAASADRVKGVLKRLGLPVAWPGLDIDDIWRIMQHDKKARGGQVRMILPTTLGAVDMFDDVTFEQVVRAVEAIQN